MGTITDILLEELTDDNEQLWWTVWQPLVHQAIADRCVELLDLNGVRVLTGWERLDEPKARAKLLHRGAALWNRCADLLVGSRRRIEALNAVLARRGFAKLGREALRSKVFAVLPVVTNRPLSERVFRENPFPFVWKLVADGLARQLYRDNSLGAIDPEWLLVNKLLLVGFFGGCSLPEARHVRVVLDECSPKPLSVRGTFIRVPEVVSPLGVEDKPIPFSGRDGGVSLRHEQYSPLLQATADESRATATGSSLLHQIIDIRDTTDVFAVQWGTVTESTFIRSRHVTFRLYEDTLLSYLSLASIEQLLRAWAAHCGVRHCKPNGVPEGVLHWLPELRCSADVDGKLRDIYDTERSNIRNRVMHGNLLEIEGKSLEVRLPIVDATRYKTVGEANPLIPGNIAQICFACLDAVDTEISRVTTLASRDLDWTRDLSLDTSEIEFGLRLHIDFLDERDVRDAWLNTMSDYLNAVFPGLKQLFMIGFIGWAQRPFTESLPRFMALGLTFESLYRLTVHLLGESILQISFPRARPCLKTQYKMLDARPTGICTPQILDRLVDHIDVEQRAFARRTLQLAIKARNSFAHGAIVDFSTDTASGIGHIFVKATQNLVMAGLHHFTRERAYFHWENFRKRCHGYHLQDWSEAQVQTFRMISAAARL